MYNFIEFTRLDERVISPGLNPEHESLREKHRQEMHDLIQKSYSDPKIGGYGGLKTGSKEESDSIHHDITHSLIKATVRGGHVTAVNLYKKQHGRKSIAVGTDGTEQGKKDMRKNKLEDHEQKRAWGEVSGAPEHIARKMGVPVIPAKRAKELLNKDVKAHPDDEHYDRPIGGEVHTKVMMGHVKK